MSSTQAALIVLGALIILGVYLTTMQPPPAAIRRITLHRCRYCHLTIWPWQRRGWAVGLLGGEVTRWHGRCWRRWHRITDDA